MLITETKLKIRKIFYRCAPAVQLSVRSCGHPFFHSYLFILLQDEIYPYKFTANSKPVLWISFEMGFTLPKQPQKSRSVLQAGSRSLGLLRKEPRRI